MSGIADGNLKHLTKEELGYCFMTPTTDVIAGEYGTWVLTYTVGKYGVDVGGGIKIGTRRMSDWGIPQFTDPTAPNYVTVKCSVSDAVLDVSYNTRGHIRTYRAVTVIDLKKENLMAGDQIVVTFGDKTFGSVGMKVQSFPETSCEFALFVDICSSGAYTRVPQLSDPLNIITGDPIGYNIQCPSKVTVGKPFKIKVNGVDMFGNPTLSQIDNLEIDTMPPIKFSISKEDGHAKWIDSCILSELGESYLRLKQGAEVIAVSNPCLVSETQEFSLFWGDTQAQTSSTVGTGSVEEYYHYAKNIAGIDFCTHQANDFMVSKKAWKEIYDGAKKFNEVGVFAAFPGYEWSGTFSAGGDRNVLFLDEETVFYCSSSWQMAVAFPEEERSTAAELHKALHTFMKEKNKKVLLVPHVGGRRANWDYYDPELEPVLEICSCHGHFEWFLHDALERGYKIGVVGASDDHTCRPGLAFPSNREMAVQNGLGGVYAEELTRESIADAIFARRCYATTGERIIVWVDAGGYPMGSDFKTEKAPILKIKVLGTAPIEEVIIFDGTRKIHTEFINNRKRIINKIRITWTGACSRDRNRYTLWDGGLTLSSGKILSVDALNMASDREKIVRQTDQEILWKSMTVGNTEGIVFYIDAPDDARISFKTSSTSFDFILKDIYEKDLHIDAGEVGQAVDITTLHYEGVNSSADFEFEDKNFFSGEHAYYVKVIQENFHKAWSSPIFVIASTVKHRH